LIGIDLVIADRINRIHHKFGNKFLSPNEQKIAKSANTIAGFWAAKEALSKALGCGIGGEFGFLDVEIQKTKKGAPYMNITPHIINNFSIKESSLSISHDGGIVIAAVMVELR
jgi:holo-[acyl-carrier protein] synthase